MGRLNGSDFLLILPMEEQPHALLPRLEEALAQVTSPHNSATPGLATAVVAYHPHDERGPLLATLDDAGFRARFAGSPIKRIGRDRMVRNALYAIGNSALPRLRPVAQALVDDPDAAVADAARWALGRLA